MNIFIDEAGSFTYDKAQNVWSTVCALVVPSASMGVVERALNEFKAENGFASADEVKFKHIQYEMSFFRLLLVLVNSHCTLFGMAVDAHVNPPEAIRMCREATVQGALRHIDKMLYQAGRDAVQFAADQVARLSDPLFVQFICQVRLMHRVVGGAINYYAQWMPAELGSFVWRIDQKNPANKTNYEDVFEKLSPAYLQTLSLSDPDILVRSGWWDYSHLQRYMYQSGSEPTYLRDVYGLDIQVADGLNIQKVFREDIQFVDSKSLFGVQLADLMSSGLRKCLRGELKDNQRAAAFMGRLMVQRPRREPPLLLLSMNDSSPVEGLAAELIRLMQWQQRPAIRRRA